MAIARESYENVQVNFQWLYSPLVTVQIAKLIAWFAFVIYCNS